MGTERRQSVQVAVWCGSVVVVVGTGGPVLDDGNGDFGAGDRNGGEFSNSDILAKATAQANGLPMNVGPCIRTGR